jgi:hypothetical protein
LTSETKVSPPTRTWTNRCRTRSGDTTRAYNLTAQPAFNSAMVNSGSFGNSGVDQMNQEGQRQLQTSLGRQANDMRSNNFWQGLGFDASNYWQNQNFDRGVYNDAFSQGQQQFQNGLNLLGMMNGANQQSWGWAADPEHPDELLQQLQPAGQLHRAGLRHDNQRMTAQGSPLMGALVGRSSGPSTRSTARRLPWAARTPRTGALVGAIRWARVV